MIKGGMTLEFNGKTIRRIFYGVAGCIILYWLLHETARVTAVLSTAYQILSPFIIGAAAAFVLNVPMRAIESLFKKIKKLAVRRALSLVLTFLAVLLLLYGVVALLGPQLMDTIQSIANLLPDFFTRVQQRIMTFLEENPYLMEWVTENTDFQNLDWNSLVQKAVTLLTDGLGNLVAKAVGAVINVGAGIFNGILSLVFAVYCLARKEILARQARRVLYSFLPEKVCDETIRIFRMANMTFSRFISGQCLEAVILAVMFAIAMSVFGMPYPLLISVIIGITALVPIVGAFAGCAVGAFFILVADPSMALWFVVLFLVLQQIEGNLIYPRVVGNSVGLPGMWVLVAVAVGGELMGVPGMLIMIPLTSVCYALAREITTKRLESRQIAREKLQDQPMDLSRKNFIPRRKKKKAQEEPKESE